jgi:ubiquitin-conjugating enzyme E2 Q
MPQYHHVAVSQSNIRQFSFVVGNPEQEAGFRREIEEAKKGKKTLEKYPTSLAFHGMSTALLSSASAGKEGEVSADIAGSGAERWHNILRTGLDFNEIACGRVSSRSSHSVGLR